MYTKIKRESSKKETQKNLKTLLNIVNNSSCYRCFLGTSGQDLDFFRKLKENTKVNLVWNGNLKKGILDVYKRQDYEREHILKNGCKNLPMI